MSLQAKRFLVVAAGVLVATVMVLLGLWQMDVFRADGRQSVEQRAAAPARPLDEVTTGTTVNDGYGRQVTLVGEYLPQHQLYIGDTYPMRVVTAFRTTDGRLVAVVRGTVASPTTSHPKPPTGQVTQTGVLLPTELDERVLVPGQDLMQPQLQTVRLPKIAQIWPTPLLNGFVTLNPDQAQSHHLGAAEVKLPEGRGSQRNAGYALQWWAFAAAAVAGSVAIAHGMKPAGRGR